MIQVNLLPWRAESKKIKLERFLAYLAISASLAIIILFLMHAYFLMALESQIKANDYLRSEITAAQGSLSGMTKEQREHFEMDLKFQHIKNFMIRNNRSLQVMNELSEAVTPEINLEKIIKTNNKILLSGVAESNAAISIFMNNLAKSPIFNQPVLSDIKHDNEQANDKPVFEINIDLKG